MSHGANHESPFTLESVARTKAPDGAEGTWYRYAIAQGSNRITGMRCGSESEVQGLLREMVERLNDRRMGKTAPRSKGRAPAQS